MPKQTKLTRVEAERRFASIRNVAYRLELELEAGSKTYRGDCTIRFDGGSAGTFLELVTGSIHDLSINGVRMDPEWDGTRLTLPGSALAESNEVRVTYESLYDHTGEGLHQFFDPEDGAEYLHTQFEPYSAHRVFPCFDQPDLKAPFDIVITAPSEWEVITAGRQIAADPARRGSTTRRFERTVPFSPYLLAIDAGNYVGVRDSHGDLPLGVFCRASLAGHLDADVILAQTKEGMDIFASFFGRPYPFTKYDQIFVPEFNAGGMENVGAVNYNDFYVFRDPPTSDQLLRRTETLLHELAHMWFGDLVTMKWWDDLWLNESFATFTSYLAMEAAGHYQDAWLDFNTRNKLPAYRDDQLPTTHPIVDDIVDTDAVFLNFDQITYGKGAASLRQLVASIGEDAFLRGLRIYFDRHAFGNTTLIEFLAALQEGSGTDMAGWASRWLQTPSLNTISARWETEGDLLSSLALEQRAPDAYPTLRPHTLEVALVSEGPGGLLVDSVPAVIEGPSAAVPGVKGLPSPRLVFPNYRDLTYAKVDLDPESLEYVGTHLGRIDDPLLRLQLWQSVWEMVRDGRFGSTEYLALTGAHLATESNVQIIRMATLTAARALAWYLPEQLIDIETHRFVEVCRRAIEVVPEGDARVVWARALVGAATSQADLELAGRLVDGEEGVTGLSIDQDMRWEVAVRASAMGQAGASSRVEAEKERDPTDRGARAVIRAETSRPDAAVKEEAWRRIHENGYESLYLTEAAMYGFRWRTQRELLRPYADGFFERVAGIFETWDFEAASDYFRGLFPHYNVDEVTIGRAGSLDADGSDPRLRRLARETADELRRALRCRRLVEHQSAEVPGSGTPGG